MPPGNLPFELLDGERLLWSGRPVTGLLFRPYDFILVPFGLVWMAFGTAFVGIALTPEMGEEGVAVFGRLAFGALGSVFALAGLFVVVGRFFVDGWSRARTTYAVTDSRVVIVRTGPFGGMTSLRLEHLPTASLALAWGGRGTIRFGQVQRFRRADNAVTTVDDRIKLAELQDPQPVFTLIQQAQQNRR